MGEKSLSKEQKPNLPVRPRPRPAAQSRTYFFWPRWMFQGLGKREGELSAGVAGAAERAWLLRPLPRGCCSDFCGDLEELVGERGRCRKGQAAH